MLGAVAKYTFFLIIAFLGCFSSVYADNSLTLRTAENRPENYPTSQALSFMAKRVDTLSQGNLKMKLYTGGQLGDERDTLELTLLGGIDINRINLAPLNSIVPETLVFTMPFIFKSKQHLRAVLDGDIGEDILASLEPYGLIGLAYYDSGARSIYNSKKAIYKPEDLKGLKIRVQNSEIYVAMIDALGASSTPMGFNQVYESLILGTIDGGENNWPSYESTGHYEVAPFLTLTEHTMTPEVLVVSKHRWQQLTLHQQQLLKQAAKESVPFMRNLWDQQVKISKKRVISKGVEVVDNIDKTAFYQTLEPIYQQLLTTEKQRSLVKRIRDAGLNLTGVEHE